MNRAFTVYLDENVDYAAIGPLRQRGYTVTTAQAEGTAGLDDDEQLAFAAQRDWLIVSHNQRHFRRWHSMFVQQQRPHAGIVILPGPSPLARLVLRLALLLD